MNPEFSRLLKHYRERAGLSQKTLADRSGVSLRTIGRFEQGKGLKPRLASIQLLANHLELTDAEYIGFLAAGDTGNDADASSSRGRESAFDRRLRAAANQLAYELERRWQQEEQRQNIHEPLPIPVSWQTVGPALADSWENINNTKPGESAPPLDLDGSLDDLVEVFQRIPSRRLVVLGRAGSGKTVLTSRFLRDLLKDRDPDAPVPVIFRLESWRPSTELHSWLATQLENDHPSLGRLLPDRSTLAAALLVTGRILPVLDGFDEMAAGLHSDALKKLNRLAGPLVLTSRPDEFAAAVAASGSRLSRAAVVDLADLTPNDLANYLPRTAHSPEQWRAVLEAVRNEPDGRLANVLATPLMVALARMVYSDGRGPDSTELLDDERFPTVESVERHLLGALIPAVYHDQPEDAQYEPERVRHWLGYLAHHFNAVGEHDLAWWKMGAALRQWARILVLTLTLGPIFALVDNLVAMVIWTPGLTDSVAGTVIDFSIAAVFGIAHELLARFRGAAFEPSRVQMRLRGKMAGTRSTVLHRFRLGCTAGFLIGFVFSAYQWVSAGVAASLDAWQILQLVAVNTAVLGFAAGLCGGGVLAVMALLERPLDFKSVQSPADLVLASRRTILVQALVFGPMLALTIPFVLWTTLRLLQQLTPAHWEWNWDLTTGALLGMYSGIFGAVGYALALTGWGRWAVFGRLWLPLTGRLPWTLPAFLEDAYSRGVLRRSGAVYQFRHARLQEHLAAAHSKAIDSRFSR